MQDPLHLHKVWPAAQGRCWPAAGAGEQAAWPAAGGVALLWSQG